MATIINITDKIKNEQKFLEYDGKKYVVNASKNAVTEAMAIFSSAGDDIVGSIGKVLYCLLGDAAKDFDEMDFVDYRTVFVAVMALATGRTYEETEKSFRT